MTVPLLEFVTLMATFTIAAGPYFAMVVRQSVVHGRRTALERS